jgi:hypothetical protein
MVEHDVGMTWTQQPVAWTILHERVTVMHDGRHKSGLKSQILARKRAYERTPHELLSLLSLLPSRSERRKCSHAWKNCHTT